MQMQLLPRQAREQHSSRRQQHTQEMRSNENMNSSDIDGTTHRVASVTLESDSLSADAPMSFRSKRRKKIPRRDKQQNEMDVDRQQHLDGEGDAGQQQKQSSAEGDDLMVKTRNIPTCKVNMDWEQSVSAGPSSSSAAKGKKATCNDMDNNQSDVLSESESASNADADDEQSDWPEFGDSKQGHFGRTSIVATGCGQHLLAQPSVASANSNKDAALSQAVIKRIEQFLADPDAKELLLDQVYRTSAVKQILREKSIPVQIVKRGRGTVAIRKI